MIFPFDQIIEQWETEALVLRSFTKGEPMYLITHFTQECKPPLGLLPDDPTGVNIDIPLVPVIESLWAAGIQTQFSCAGWEREASQKSGNVFPASKRFTYGMILFPTAMHNRRESIIQIMTECGLRNIHESGLSLRDPRLHLDFDRVA